MKRLDHTKVIFSATENDSLGNLNAHAVKFGLRVYGRYWGDRYGYRISCGRWLPAVEAFNPFSDRVEIGVEAKPFLKALETTRAQIDAHDRAEREAEAARQAVVKAQREQQTEFEAALASHGIARNHSFFATGISVRVRGNSAMEKAEFIAALTNFCTNYDAEIVEGLH